MTPLPHTPPPESVADAILHDLCEQGALWPAVERMLRARLPEVPGWVRQAGEYQPYLPPQGMARFSLGREPEAVCSVWRRADGWYRWDAERRDVGPFDTQHAAMADADTKAREAGWLFDPSLPLEKPQPQQEPTPDGRLPCEACEGTGRVRLDGRQVRCGNCDGSGREGFLAGIVRRLFRPEPQPEPTPAPVREEGTPRGPRQLRGPSSPIPGDTTGRRHRWTVVRQEVEGRIRFLQRCERCEMWRESRRRRVWPANYTFDEAYEALSWGNGERRAGACRGEAP